MSAWYRKVVDNIANIIECIEHFEDEYAASRKELTIKGKPLEKHSSELPGIFEHRFSQLQEIEAILEHLNILLRKKRSETFKKYFEHYQRQLSARECEKYVDSEPDVVDLTHLVNEFALLRNKYLSMIKGLDAKSFQINNIVKLRVAGLEDAEVQ